MISGTGISLVAIQRVERVAAGRPSALQRWYNESERTRAFRRARPGEELAGRLACKLAVRLALQPLLPPGHTPALNEIVTENDSLGKPYVTLSAALQQLLSDVRACTIHVSITHARDHAAAIAVVESHDGR